MKRKKLNLIKQSDFADKVLRATGDQRHDSCGIIINILISKSRKAVSNIYLNSNLPSFVNFSQPTWGMT